MRDERLAIVVVAIDAIIVASLHAALLETGVPNCRGTGHSARASRGSNSLLPWTTLGPRFTRASEGNPFLRLLMTSKRVELVEVCLLPCHTPSFARDAAIAPGPVRTGKAHQSTYRRAVTPSCNLRRPVHV